MTVTQTQPQTDTRVRMPFRVHSQSRARAEYWAAKRGYTSVNEYVAEALEEKISRENQDYDLPTLEIARVNQLRDEVHALSTNVANLEATLQSSLGSLLQLTKGTNYLLDEESGEL